jgi:putative CocE/NonD family hydrolase
VSLARRGLRVHQLLGQWNHQYPDDAGTHTRWDWADRLLAWFDHELKGDASASLGAPVEVEDDAGKWRRASAWPPAAERDVLQLAADGTLARKASPATATTTLASDSRSRYYYLGQTAPEYNTDDDPQVSAAVDDTCATCATFSMRTLKAMRIAGLPEVHVTVTPTGSSGHVTAFLYRKDAAGLHRIGFGMSDLRFPKGENSGDEKAREVVAGEPVKVRIELEPLDALVHAGDQIELVLGQGRTGQIPAQAPMPVQLGYGGGQSTMTLPVIHPAPGDFFTPPGPNGRQLP